MEDQTMKSIRRKDLKSRSSFFVENITLEEKNWRIINGKERGEKDKTKAVDGKEGNWRERIYEQGSLVSSTTKRFLKKGI